MILMSCTLEARRADANIARRYRAELSRDLFGHAVLELAWGRIGARGQRLRLSAPEPDALRPRLEAALKRRASAPRRIGAAYRIVELHDPAAWLHGATAPNA